MEHKLNYSSRLRDSKKGCSFLMITKESGGTLTKSDNLPARVLKLSHYATHFNRASVISLLAFYK
jgi:hypothetical protein